MFAIGLHELITKIARDFANVGVLVVAYCDDIALVGPPLETIRAFNALNAGLGELKTREGSLEFNLSKCWAYSPTDGVVSGLGEGVLPEGIKVKPADTGYKFLGAFASRDPQWISDQAVEKFVTEHEPLHTAIRSLAEYGKGPAVQCAALISSFCASPRIGHFSRLVPPDSMVATVKAHTERMMLTLTHLIGHDALFLTNPTALALLPGIQRERVLLARQQANLPAEQGGVGHEPLHLLHPAAYCSSWITTLSFLKSCSDSHPALAAYADITVSTSALVPIRQLRAAWGALTTLLGGTDKALCTALRIDTIDSLSECAVSRPQHALARVISKKHAANLVTLAPSEDDRIRLLSCRGIAAGAWLGALPSQPATQMDDLSWRTAAARRIGTLLPCLKPGSDKPCHATRCPTPPDPYGHHIMHCPLSHKFGPHQMLLHALESCCKRAGVPAEASRVNRMNVSLKELLGQSQADLLIKDFRGMGMDAHLDVTIIHPILPSYAHVAYEKPGDALNLVRSALKLRKYADLDTLGNLFIVFGAESFGALDPDGVRFFNDFIVQGYCLSRMVDPSTFRGSLVAMRFRQQSFAQISVAVQNAYAKLLHQSLARRHPRDLTRVLGLSSRATFHRVQRSRTRHRAASRAFAAAAATNPGPSAADGDELAGTGGAES